MPLSIALYSPDRGVEYDGRTPADVGVGGGITARVSLLEALAARGHDVVAYVNCRERLGHAGVDYVPLDACVSVDADVLIAMTTGGARSFAPLAGVPVRAGLRVLWVQGVPQPAAVDLVAPDVVHVASNFLRDVCAARWGVAEQAIFTCYNGLHQERFARVEAAPPPRDPYAIAYIGPPEKGLGAAIAVLRRLRREDDRFHLDVFGGAALWGARRRGPSLEEPGVTFRGLVGQDAITPALFAYEYCLALQSIEEGFGIGVQEAKRAGQIVIASRVGAFAELIRSSYDGRLVDGSHEDPGVLDTAAAAILDLACDTRRRARLRSQAMQTPWSWSMAAATVEAFWEQRLHGGVSNHGASVDDRFLDLPDGRHSARTGHYFPTVYPLSPMFDRVQPPPRILIAGYYGHGNLGDETILASVLEDLRDAVPNVGVTVVSARPQDTARRHDVAAVHERDLPGLFDAAAASDLVVLGGGGLLQDQFGVDPATVLSNLHWGLTYCAGFAALASLLHKPFALLAIGAGPLTTPEGRRFARLTVERAARATVRDDESLAILRSTGADVSRVEVTADPAVLVDAAPAEAIDPWIAELAIEDRRPTIAVVARDWPDSEHEAALAAALDRLIGAVDARIVFVPFQDDDPDQRPDRWAAERVRSRMHRAAEASVARACDRAPAMAALFSRCDLVIAMRLHAALLAAVAGTPVVALAYDPKVTQAMRRFGLAELVVPLAEAQSSVIVDRAAAALARRSSIRSQLEPAREALRRGARQNTMVLAALLRDRPSPPPASAEWTAMMEDMVVRQIRRAAVSELHRETAARDVGAHERTLAAVLQALGDSNRRTLELIAAAPAPADTRAVDMVAALPSASADVAALEAALASTSRDLARLSAELATIRTSRAWQAVTRYRAWRRRGGQAARHPGRAILAASRRIARALIPAPRRQAIRQAWRRRLMTPYMYAFDRYRRARLQRYGVDLSRLRTPGESGLVSIVLPAYNGARHIREAIDSVLAQSCRSFELIVVNDGSTDETPAIAEEYARADPRVRVLHQPNSKLPGALSRGFAEARGEFLTWTSCDNRMKPRCLELLLATLRRHPSWDMVYGNLDIIGDDGAFLRGAEHYEGYQRPHGSEHVHLPRSTAELNVWANNSIGAAFLYRSHVPLLIGDYSPFRFVTEDYDYWMRVNALMTLAHAGIDEPIYDYRFHVRSLTARWDELGMLASRERLMVFEEFRRDFYLSPALWRLTGADTPLTRALAERLRRAGHLVVDGTASTLPSLWLPAIHLHATENDGGAESPPAPSPRGALRVLVTSARAPAARVDPCWDLCVATSAPSPLARLPGARQGWLGAADPDALFRAVDIRAKSDQLARIEALAESPAAATLDASVIVCTHRFSPRVLAAVESAFAQSFARDRYEIVVVNNAPEDRRLAAALTDLRRRHGCTGSDRLRLIDCPIPGLSPARNAGLSEARGNVLAFLDDDAIADREWLARLCRAYDEHPDAGVIGGHITLRVPEPRPAALRPGWEKYWSQFLTGYSGYTVVNHWWEFPWGANWSARRMALYQAGGFRAQYGRKGEDFGGGEELIAAAIIQRLGYTVAVLPEAAVVHDVDPARFTFDHVRRTMLAGHLVSYQAQRDLYIPFESGLRTTLAQIAGRHVDAALPARDRVRDWRYRKQAQVTLLAAQLADLRRRRRKPAIDHGEGR